MINWPLRGLSFLAPSSIFHFNFLSFHDLLRARLTETPISSTLIVLQTIVALANRATINAIDPSQASPVSSKFPVKGCMFFGVPHKGAHIASTALKFLSVLGHVFNVNKRNLRDLEAKSQRFANTSSDFRQVRSDYGIPVISFYETVEYNRTLGVVSCMSTST